MPDRIDVSVVATLFKSEDTIHEFHRRIVAALDGYGPYEIILVNDGCPERSLQQAINLHNKDPNVVVVDLSRNFGHHRAMMTGLTYARGDAVFLIDSDLEEDPALLKRFMHRMQDEALNGQEADVVYGIQGARRGGWIERFSGNLFYWLLDHLADRPEPVNQATVRLMTQRYVRALLSHQEREMAIAGLWAATGFRQVPELIEKPRLHKTHYNLTKRIQMGISAVVLGSPQLLSLLFYFGTTVALISFALLSIVIVRPLFGYATADGWTSIIASIWFFGGAILAALGIIGLFLARIYLETKQRPYSIVRRVISAKPTTTYGVIDGSLVSPEPSSTFRENQNELNKTTRSSHN